MTEEELMNQPVGTVCEVDGKRVRVEYAKAEGSCEGCVFWDEGCGTSICYPEERPDGKDVIFVEVPDETPLTEVPIPAAKGIPIPAALYSRMCRLGLIPNPVRDTNVGASDYSRHLIQPWAIWQEYGLNPRDADIIKRVLRTKSTDPRRLDYEKIIHICRERIRQIDCMEGADPNVTKSED